MTDPSIDRMGRFRSLYAERIAALAVVLSACATAPGATPAPRAGPHPPTDAKTATPRAAPVAPPSFSESSGPPPADAVTRVAAGSHHVCALRRSGNVDCWGLLPGAHVTRPRPTRIPGMAGATEIASAERITCARLTSGAVRCLTPGSGEMADGAPRTVEVAGVDDADAIAVGSTETFVPAASLVAVCARRRTGRVACASSKDAEGALPSVAVTGVMNPAGLAVGPRHSASEDLDLLACALDRGGAASCWHVGGTTAHARKTRLRGAPPLERLALDARGACGIRLDDRTASCFVLDEGLRARDVRRVSRSPAELVSAGCWLERGTSDAMLTCDHASGSRTVPSATQVTVALRPAPQDPSGCAVLVDGSVSCWGDNEGGFAGGASTIPVGSAKPVTVVGLGEAVDVAVGDRFSCALRQDGSVWCWGGPPVDGAAPLEADDCSGEPPCVDLVRRALPRMLVPGDVTSLSKGADDVCMLFRDGHVECVHAEVRTLEVVRVPIPGRVTALRAWRERARARTMDGRTWLWSKAHGLREQTTSDPPERGLAASVPDVAEIAESEHLSCARTRAGRVFCAPRTEASTSAGPPPATTSLTAVSRLEDAIDLEVGSSTACARRRTGAARCWGVASGGEVVDFEPERAEPELHGTARISLGWLHGCALKPDGHVVCFGLNRNGELGDGSLERAARPVRILGL